ncbi:MAG TPA: hypothetical protein PL182_12290, partial [Pseudobdellovibrionaceae bacterium]|nr:hypothetical protein [Pseudobdellovibrionaceae bacterium]
MKSRWVFTFALLLGGVASAHESGPATEYETLCFGEGCEKTSTVPNTGVGQVEYIQAKILPQSNYMVQIYVQNQESGETLVLSPKDRNVGYIRADGSLVAHISEAAYVILPNYYFPLTAQRFAKAGGVANALKLVTWNECGGSVIGRYILGRSCSSRPIHPSLLTVLQKDLARIAGGKKVEMIHKGIMGDSNHTERKSLHNTGRAVDVAEFIVDGKKYSYATAVSNPNSAARKFYLKLMAGWEKAVKSRCRGTVAATTIYWTDKN